MHLCELGFSVMTVTALKTKCQTTLNFANWETKILKNSEAYSITMLSFNMLIVIVFLVIARLKQVNI